MAPRFETAQPFVPDISAAYGAGEAMLRANPQLADAYESAARLTAQTREAAADRQFRSREAGLGRAQDAAGQSAAAMGRFGAINAETQQREFDRFQQNQQLYARLGAEAQQQQFEARARAESQALGSWLRRQEFTYADQLELQKQERQLRAVMSSPELTDAEKRRVASMLTTGIDSLRLRQQETQTKMLEAKAKQVEQESVLLARAQTTGAQLEREAKEKGFGVLNFGVDPDSMTPRLLFKNPTTGEWYNPLQGSGGRGGAAQQRQDQLKQAMDASGAASKQASEMIAARQKAELPLDDWMKTPEGVTQKTVELARAQAVAAKAYIAELTGQGGPGPQTAEARKAAESPDPAAWVGGFDPADPATQSGQQKQWLAKQNQMLAEVAVARVPLLQRTAFEGALRERIRLAAKPNKTAEDMARIKALAQVGYEETPAAAAEQQPPPPPPPVRPVFTTEALSMRGGF